MSGADRKREEREKRMGQEPEEEMLEGGVHSGCSKKVLRDAWKLMISSWSRGKSHFAGRRDGSGGRWLG